MFPVKESTVFKIAEKEHSLYHYKIKKFLIIHASVNAFIELINIISFISSKTTIKSMRVSSTLTKGSAGDPLLKYKRQLPIYCDSGEISNRGRQNSNISVGLHESSKC